MDDITSIMEIVGQFGFSSIFLWLFVREMNRHDTTRENYRNDLREIAGIRSEEFIQRYKISEKLEGKDPQNSLL